MTIQQGLAELLQAALAVHGFDLWGYELNSYEGHQRLQVYIDTPNGVTIDDCERASRQISAVLDVEDPISSQYNLEVSSPGLERPLFTQAQYQQYIGKNIKLRMNKAQDNRRNYRGQLVEVSEDSIVMTVDETQVVLPFGDIEKANVVLDF
ncbi:MAG: ribosome maturation factor RimP [Pseudomonadota bacterium]|nr:ribosome maturation factor RimP [Pseudomonadota bacterium]